jgi:hypothetical protein
VTIAASTAVPMEPGEVRDHRLYQLIRRKGVVHDATFEIEFLDPGIEVFSFTLGLTRFWHYLKMRLH